MYLPWGLGFSRDILVRDFGARNVIYTDGNEDIPEHLKWRTDILNVDSYDLNIYESGESKEKHLIFLIFLKERLLLLLPI